jgi:hypothetical protein
VQGTWLLHVRSDSRKLELPPCFKVVSLDAQHRFDSELPNAEPPLLNHVEAAITDAPTVYGYIDGPETFLLNNRWRIILSITIHES